MTNRLIRPRNDLIETGQTQLKTKRVRWGESLIVEKPSEDGSYQIFFDENGNIYPIQEVFDKYGQNSKELCYISKKILNSRVNVYSAVIPCSSNISLLNSNIQLLRPCNKRKHIFSVCNLPLNDLYAKIFVEIKNAFLKQDFYFSEKEGSLAA